MIASIIRLLYKTDFIRDKNRSSLPLLFTNLPRFQRFGMSLIKLILLLSIIVSTTLAREFHKGPSLIKHINQDIDDLPEINPEATDHSLDDLEPIFQHTVLYAINRFDPENEQANALLRTVLSSCLQSYQFSLDFYDEHGQTPLYLSILKGFEEAGLLLVMHGASLDSMHDGQSMLLHATKSGMSRLASSMASRGARYTLQESTSTHLFMTTKSLESLPIAWIAAIYGLDMLKAAITGGAKLFNHDGKSLLHVAVMDNLPDMADMILSANHSLHNIVDVYFMTPLHLAAIKGHIEVADAMLNKGASINIKVTCPEGNLNCKNNQGMTPLMLAIRNQRHVMTSFLLTKGADAGLVIDTLDGKISALWFAVKLRLFHIAQELIRYGAVVDDTLYRHDETLLRIAERFNDTNMFALLKAHLPILRRKRKHREDDQGEST